MSTPHDTALDQAFGMVVRFTLRDGHGQAFDDLMERTVAKIRQHEPETLAYVVHHVEGEPLTRIFYELYASNDAFQHHQGQDYIADFKAQREAHVERVEVYRLGVNSFAGIAPDAS